MQNSIKSDGERADGGREQCVHRDLGLAQSRCFVKFRARLAFALLLSFFDECYELLD